MEDPHEPDNILEAYSFTFQYTDGTASTRTLSGVEVADLRGDTICVKDARFEVNKLSFQLASLCKNMPSLPEQRHMKMVLRHTPDCPKNYVPPGFEASSSTDVEISFPIATGWKKVDAVLKELDFGPHKLQFSAAHLSYSGPENHDSGTGDDTRRIPTNLSYGTPINLFEADGEMDGAEQPNLQTVIERPVENPACSPSPTASDMDLDDVPLVIRKPLLHSGPSSSPVLSAVTDNREAPVVTVGSSAIPRSTNTGSPPGRPEDLLDRERLHRMVRNHILSVHIHSMYVLLILIIAPAFSPADRYTEDSTIRSTISRRRQSGGVWFCRIPPEALPDHRGPARVVEEQTTPPEKPGRYPPKTKRLTRH